MANKESEFMLHNCAVALNTTTHGCLKTVLQQGGGGGGGGVEGVCS